MFLQNYAKQGAGIFFEGRTAATITNCTFFDNRLVGGTYFGADIYCRGTSWQYGGGPYISNSIFTGEPGNTDPVPLRDIYSTESVNGYKIDLHLQHSATVTEPQYNFGGAIIHPRSIVYRNAGNPVGPDGRWFTSDDGLQQVPCSAGIDVGANNRVNAATDISQGTRIFNTKVDMGAYESVGQADWSGLLNTASDSLIANKEVTDTLGWTHYFNGCRYLLSIKKDGKAIGTVGDGSFELKVFTSANYGTGKGMNLTDAAYNTSGMPWYVMNRYWNVKSNYVIKDSILVRFPYTNADFNDVKGSNPSVTEQNELVFFKVSGTNNPFDLSVPASRFFRYTNAALPSLSTWKHLQQDTIRLSEYYVNGFSGGGGGAYYNGDLPDLIISNVSLPVTSIGTGESITASFTVSNNSTTGIAGGNNVMLFLSKDKQLTPGLNGDSLLATVSVQSLGVSASTGVLEKQVFIPCTLAPGNYYLFFLSDGNNNVAEANEHNNSSAAIPLTVTTGLSMPAISAITASPAATVCSGTNVTLTVNSANCASCNYTWSNGSDGNTTTVTTTSNLTVTATNVCGSATVSQQVVVKPLPTIAVWPGKSEICLNDSVTLNANGAESFTWNGVGLRSVTGAIISAIPTTPGVNEYIVTGITNGCSSSTKVSVAVLPAPVLSIAPLDTTVCQGQSLTLTASGAVGYDWSPASGLNTRTGSVVIASPASTTTYVLTGTSANGCKSTISRTITPKVLVVPAVSIAYTGCPENKLSFTANSTNGGSNPQYQWYMNGQYQGSGQTITLNGMANGAAVFVKMTSDAACAYPLTVSSDTVKVACITTSVPVVSGLEELSVSPNPGNGLLQVKFKLTTLKTVSFIVTNSEGKRVHQTTPVKIFGSSTQKIDLRGQPQGLYFVQIAINDKTIVERVVIAQ
ncbi:MAG: T9SS type A sorting domain-containing protein [Sphingobacteriales bacterium]|nr:MAG: T9SS type A sorting domain-containing protein [Sphingobacteriales bacterium]